MSNEQPNPDVWLLGGVGVGIQGGDCDGDGSGRASKWLSGYAGGVH